MIIKKKERKKENLSFPGGSVVKKLLANARDKDLIPDMGRSHMPRSNKACAL